MAKISRIAETVVASSAQDRPIMTTEAKEIYRLEDGANLSRGLAEQEDEDDEGAEDDEEVGHDEVSRGNHMMVHERQTSATNYHHDHHSHLGHNHQQHVPACKLVNTELAAHHEPTRYQHRPHCLHHDHHHLHPHAHLHKPNCAVHNSNQPLGSNQKLFKNLIAQQHVQLSAATMKMAHGPETTGRLHAFYRPTSDHQHHQQRPARHLRLSPPGAADPQHKSKYLLVEYQRPKSSHLAAPSLSLSGESIVRRHDDRSRINIRQHRTSRHMTTTSDIDRDHARQPGTSDSGKRQKQTRTTTTTPTVNFIAQLYFLIHLSAMISLLLHHRNLVSNESRHRLQQQQQQQQTALVMQTMQQLSQQEQIYAATTRRSSQVALPVASHSDHNQDMHHRRGHIQLRANASNSQLPSLPVPETQQMPPGVHQHQINDEFSTTTTTTTTNANHVATSNGRLVRSIFGPDDLNSRLLDATSPDILVRLVGRTHAESALQYFLCYLLSSSITILIFLWLVRICTASEANKNTAGHRWTKRSGRLIETRQDCTPVLIGSISLGLIQLIVIGLDIADNIDWLTTSAGHTPLGLTANYAAEQTRAHGGAGQWPIFVPMLQFVFVSLLMQYILAKVARIRGLMGLIEQGEEEDEEDEEGEEKEEDEEDERTEDEESERRVHRMRAWSRHRRRQAGGERREARKCLSDNLQNIALAHLLVTHILLWLMKLNSISLFQTSAGTNLDDQQVFVPFVASPSPLPPPLPPLTTSTTLPPATTSSTTQPPLRTTAAPSFVLDHFGAAGEPASSSGEPELHQQGERNNGQAATTTTTTPTDERPRREKVLSSMRNANLLADNHPTGARAKQPQLVIVAATRTVDNSSGRVETPTRSTTTTTTGRPSETTTTLTTPRLVSNDARVPIGETSDAHDRDDSKLISLVPPPRTISITTTRVPHITTAAANNTKNERDLYANNRRRPLAPKTYNDADDANHDGVGLEPIRGPGDGAAGKPWASLSPMSPVRVDTTATKLTAGLQSTLAELRPANLSASLFKSSLPKRMTAFRQGRPSQRVNLATSSGTVAATSEPGSTASTAPPIGSRTTTTSHDDGDKTFSLKSSHARVVEQRPSRGGEQRHRVRVTVDREHSFPQSIDLSDVIPAPGAGRNRATSERERENEEQDDENEISDSPPATPFRTTDRPFPSVDDDPPPSTTSTTTTTTKSPKQQRTTDTGGQLDRTKEREPNESVAVATNRTRVVATPTQANKSPAVKIPASELPKPVVAATTPMPNGADDDQAAEDEADDSTTGDEAGELDLDALLPPVPNYSNETSGEITATSGGGDDGAQTDEEALRLLASETPRRRARKMRLGANTTTSVNQALLDEAAFVFNEAASSRVANVTARPSQLNETTSPKRTNVTDDGSNSTHSLDSVGKEALTLQQQSNQQGKSQQQQQQPTFSDFLLPIVQQYHILVLTILFNMWLDSMQQQQRPRSKQQDKRARGTDSGPTLVKHPGREPHVSRRRSTPKKHLVLDRASSSSGGDLSPGASSSSAILGGGGSRSLSEADLLAHAVDSSSMSRDSSTKQLVSAQDHLARYDKQRAARRRPPVDSSQQVASRRRHPLAVGEPRRGRSRAGRLEVHAGGSTEISSSVCSVFFGLLVVSGSLIVILLGVDLLSLLVQCAIQLISIAICLLGLCVVWRIKVARQLEARNLLRAKRGRDHKLASNKKTNQIEHRIAQHQQQRTNTEQEAISHKSSFHYLFLLAAYYCGISVALNLGQQHQIQRLFPPSVIQFLQRLFANNSTRQMLDVALANEDAKLTNGIIFLNLQFLFYGALTLKGLVLIVQVTLQTILIRSSWRWSNARAELRQIYTFLMFTNLSLWALEICDQQQQMLLVKHQHQHQVAMQQQQQQQVAGLQHLLPANSHNFELLTLEGFTRFAGSVVTLSHLYHGLVFMQH